MTTELDTAKYISFISYKRDGAAVATPVWVVPFEGGYAFTTEGTSYKVKRIRNNPAAAAKVCGVRGAVKPGAIEHVGTAEVLDGAASASVHAAIKRKYWLGYAVLIAPAQLWAKVRKRPGANEHTAIKFTITA